MVRERIVQTVKYGQFREALEDTELNRTCGEKGLRPSTFWRVPSREAVPIREPAGSSRPASDLDVVEPERIEGGGGMLSSTPRTRRPPDGRIDP